MVPGAGDHPRCGDPGVSLASDESVTFTLPSKALAGNATASPFGRLSVAPRAPVTGVETTFSNGGFETDDDAQPETRRMPASDKAANLMCPNFSGRRVFPIARSAGLNERKCPPRKKANHRRYASSFTNEIGVTTVLSTRIATTTSLALAPTAAAGASAA
jgi:hypothetical protein